MLQILEYEVKIETLQKKMQDLIQNIYTLYLPFETITI